MFCPQCGQQQVTGVVRFCSRCGFPMDGVIQLLATGGIVPAYRTSDEPVPISPRRKGVKQGATLLLLGVVLVPILGMFASFAQGSTFLEILAGLAAIICFIGGPLRMLYAGLFEEGAPKPVPTLWTTDSDARAATVYAAPSSACVAATAGTFAGRLASTAKHSRTGKSPQRHRKHNPLAGKRRTHRSIGKALLAGFVS